MRRALLSGVYQAAAAAALPGAGDLDLPAAWDLLTRIDASSPEVLAPCWRIRMPASGPCAAWSSSGRWRARPAAQRPGPVAADLGHLGAIAAAAAIRSGVDARVTVPVLDGAVYLPTFGRLVIGPGAAAAGLAAGPALATATVEVTSDVVTVRAKTGQWSFRVPMCWLAKQQIRTPDPAAGSRCAG